MSIGIIRYHAGDGRPLQELLAEADAAMFNKKHEGKVNSLK